MRKVRVAVLGTTGKSVEFNPNATVGADLGVDVRLDGTVATPQAVLEWLGIATNSRTRPSGGVTHHRLLQGLTLGNDHPQYPLKAGTETISGQWNFTQQVRAADGSAAAPSYSWEADRDNGLYRIGADNIGFATGGVLRWDINTSRVFQDIPQTIRDLSGLFIENPDYLNAGLELTTITGSDPHNNGIGNQIAFWEVGTGGAFTDRSYGFRIRHTGELNTEGNLDWYRHQNDVNGVLFLRFKRDSSQIFGAAGTAGAPLYSFFDDDDSGMYLVAAGQLGFARNGTNALTIDNGFIECGAGFEIRSDVGSSSTPGFGFSGDSDTGMYRGTGTANTLAFATGATDRLTIGNTDTSGSGLTRGIRAMLSIRGADGSATVPAFTFTSDDNTGFYWVGADQLGVSVGGTLRATWTTAALVLTVPVSAPNGAVGAPAYAFTNDLDSGMYRIGTDTIGFATAGVERLRIDANGGWGLAGANFGTAGQVFTSNGTGAAPTWQDSGTPTLDQTFITEADETGTLTNSRQLIAGTSVSFDTTTPGQLEINVTAGTGNVDSVVAGTGIAVDATDPVNPIVSLNFNALTADATPDPAADYVATYDASAATHKKVLLSVARSQGANPSVSVGLSAVNGTATTFMRSDGAPALDQSIAPTWTGNHIFAPASGTGITVQAAGPSIAQIETDQAADSQRWSTRVVSGLWQVVATLDDSSAARQAFGAQRNAASSAITDVQLGNATNNPTFSFLGTGLASFGGGVTATGNVITTSGRMEVIGTTALILYNETDQGTDLKLWRTLASGGAWSLQTRTDADGAGASAISFNRSTTTVTSIEFGSTAQDTQLQIPAVNDAATPTLSFLGDTDTGIFRAGGNILAFATAGTEFLRINGSGAIGLSGANYGTTGQVMTSNGSGAAPTWEDAGTGSLALDDLSDVTAASPNDGDTIIFDGTNWNQAHSVDRATILANEILADTPNVYWKLNEASGNFSDSSGNARTLTASGSPSYRYCNLIPGSTEQHVYWDASADKGTRADTCGFSTPVTGDWTIEVIICTQAVGSQVGIFGVGASGETEATNFQIYGRVEAGGGLGTFWENGAGATDVTTTTTLYSATANGFPIHVAIVKDGTANTVTYYINGRILDVKSYANEPTGGSSCTTEVHGNVGGGTMSPAAMAHLAVFPSALSQARVTAHCRAAGYCT